jgi:outer membrane protein
MQDLTHINAVFPHHAQGPAHSTSIGKTMRHLTALTLATALVGAVAAPVFAQEQGDFTLGFGFAGVFPKSNNGVLAAGTVPIDVGDGYSVTLTGEYFVADNIGIELLAAWPFSHDLKSNGTKIGKVKHLPPTLSLQYHFTNASSMTPFVGIGVNYTTFLEDTATGPLTGSALSVDDSWGLALHAGVDFAVSETGAFRADIRWIDINSDVKLNGVNIGKVEIDPWILGVSYVMKF